MEEDREDLYPTRASFYCSEIYYTCLPLLVKYGLFQKQGISDFQQIRQ